MSSGYVVVDRLDSIIEDIVNLTNENTQKIEALQADFNTRLKAIESQLEYISGQLKSVTTNQTSAMSKTYDVRVINWNN